MYETVEQIAEACGVRAAVIICAAYGRPAGGSLYVPASPAPDHPIAELIGHHRALSLAQRYGNQTIPIPMLDSLHTMRQQAQARYLHKRGVPTEVIAWVMDLAPAEVHRLTVG